MNTKPFDLNKALEGHPSITISGEKVIHIAHFTGLRKPVVVLLMGENEVRQYTSEGNYCASKQHSPLDLLLEVKTDKRWARVTRRRNTGALHIAGGYITKQDAEFGLEVSGYETLPAYEYEIEI